MCNRNLQPAASPEGLQLPVAEDQIEVAKETQRENKGAMEHLRHCRHTSRR